MRCKKKKREESIFPQPDEVKYLAVWCVPGGDVFDVIAAEWQEPDGQTKSRLRFRNEVSGEKTIYNMTGSDLDKVLGIIVGEINVETGCNLEVAKLIGNEFWQRMERQIAEATIVDGMGYINVCVDGGGQNG
jgi:hypothetical protein